jgi:hypothetical protein
VLQGTYALRVIRGAASSPGLLRGLGESVCFAARFDHPNLARAHEILEDGNDIAVVLDAVEGLRLDHALTQSRDTDLPIPREAALELVLRVLDALESLQQIERQGELPACHGRVDPRHVWLTPDGGLRLVGLPGDADPAGPDPWAAPELRSGPTPTGAADLFGAGRILLELLVAGRIRAIERHTVSAGRPSAWPAGMAEAVATLDLSDPVVPVLLRLIAPAPERRPHSALEAIAELAPLRAPGGGTPALAAYVVAAVERDRALRKAMERTDLECTNPFDTHRRKGVEDAVVTDPGLPPVAESAPGAELPLPPPSPPAPPPPSCSPIAGPTREPEFDDGLGQFLDRSPTVPYVSPGVPVAPPSAWDPQLTRPILRGPAVLGPAAAESSSVAAPAAPVAPAAPEVAASHSMSLQRRARPSPVSLLDVAPEYWMTAGLMTILAMALAALIAQRLVSGA